MFFFSLMPLISNLRESRVLPPTLFQLLIPWPIFGEKLSFLSRNDQLFSLMALISDLWALRVLPPFCFQLYTLWPFSGKKMRCLSRNDLLFSVYHVISYYKLHKIFLSFCYQIWFMIMLPLRSRLSLYDEIYRNERFIPRFAILGA